MFWIFLILLGLGRTWACPSSCICKWKGGKQTVECINKSLITIPSGMDPGTQVLDFAGNNLDRLLKERFQRMGLINLQKIFLSRCRIKHIEDRAFKGLTNLVELDLSDNAITSVPSETFYDYPSLMRLSLNGNPIHVIHKGAFHPLTFLINLEMSKCEIETIEDGAFQEITSLEWLKLDNNKLQHISGENILPISLHGIDLSYNPWQCDCNMIDLRLWLAKFGIPQSVEPVCASPPQHKGVQVKSIDTSLLACVPDVRPTPIFLEIAEGQNASLLCQVSSIPEAKVSWWYQGNVLQNDTTVAPGLHLYYFFEEGTFSKTSELFIFNANADDNGTFACIAENPAGKAHSNYTIRIILKEEPVIGLTVFPYEYFVVISAVASIIVVLSVICITLCVVQCRRQKTGKRKKDRSKVSALQHQQVNNKTGVPMENEPITRIGQSLSPPKTNGSIVMGQEIMAFTTGPGVLVIPNNLKFTSPSNLPQSFTEQNPDLINDTGSKEWRAVNGKEGSGIVETDVEKGWVAGTLPRRDMFPKHLTADVHLSPGKFIDQDGYPLDYGLPKMPGSFPVMMPSTSFYRTLPHKPRQAPGAKFAREAEFIQKSGYEQYAPPNIRYTAEGYPTVAATPFTCFQQDPFISPPAGYKCDPRDLAAQWPESSVDTVMWTQSVGAQTSDQQGENQVPTVPPAHPPIVASALPARLDPLPLTESPDEGYEGETVEN